MTLKLSLFFKKIMEVVNLTKHDTPQMNKNTFEMLQSYFSTLFAKEIFSHFQLHFHSTVSVNCRDLFFQLLSNVVD